MIMDHDTWYQSIDFCANSEMENLLFEHIMELMERRLVESTTQRQRDHYRAMMLEFYQNSPSSYYRTPPTEPDYQSSSSTIDRDFDSWSFLDDDVAVLSKSTFRVLDHQVDDGMVVDENSERECDRESSRFGGTMDESTSQQLQHDDENEVQNQLDTLKQPENHRLPSSISSKVLVPALAGVYVVRISTKGNRIDDVSVYDIQQELIETTKENQYEVQCINEHKVFDKMTERQLNRTDKEVKYTLHKSEFVCAFKVFDKMLEHNMPMWKRMLNAGYTRNEQYRDRLSLIQPWIDKESRSVSKVFDRLTDKGGSAHDAAALVSISVGSQVWVEDSKLAWIDGEATPIIGQGIHVQLTNGKKVVASTSKDFPKDIEAPPGGVDDMIKLSYLPGAALGKSSGAGKTETTKILMKDLANLGGRAGVGGTAEQQHLESNPVLEVFGNARTSWYNNSSRFRKLIELQFDKRKLLLGEIPNHETQFHILMLKEKHLEMETASKSYNSIFARPIWIVAENHRFERAFVELKTLMAHVGDRMSVQVIVGGSMNNSNPYFSSSWRRDFTGGSNLDMGVHFIAGPKMLVGSEVIISALTSRIDTTLLPPDIISSPFKLENGCSGIFVMVVSSKSTKIIWRVVGSEGTIHVERGSNNGQHGYLISVYSSSGNKSFFYPLSGVIMFLRSTAITVFSDHVRHKQRDVTNIHAAIIHFFSTNSRGKLLLGEVFILLMLEDKHLEMGRVIVMTRP